MATTTWNQQTDPGSAPSDQPPIIPCQIYLQQPQSPKVDRTIMTDPEMPPPPQVLQEQNSNNNKTSGPRRKYFIALAVVGIYVVAGLVGAGVGMALSSSSSQGDEDVDVGESHARSSTWRGNRGDRTNGWNYRNNTRVPRPNEWNPTRRPRHYDGADVSSLSSLTTATTNAFVTTRWTVSLPGA